MEQQLIGIEITGQIEAAKTECIALGTAYANLATALNTIVEQGLEDLPAEKLVNIARQNVAHGAGITAQLAHIAGLVQALQVIEQAQN